VDAGEFQQVLDVRNQRPVDIDERGEEAFQLGEVGRNGVNSPCLKAAAGAGLVP
jgi:hypothetical protein